VPSPAQLRLRLQQGELERVLERILQVQWRYGHPGIVPEQLDGERGDCEIDAFLCQKLVQSSRSKVLTGMVVKVKNEESDGRL